MFPSKYPGVWKPRKHIKRKGKLFSKAELSWETACWNREPGSAPQSRGWSRWSGSPPAPTLHACVDSPHFWGRCMWWIAPWPAPVGVAEKNRASCFPYWRHDFRAPSQLSAVNVYTACSSSGGPPLLTHRAGAQHPLTEHLACAPRGRIIKKWTTIRQSQRWTIGLCLGGTSRFLSPPSPCVGIFPLHLQPRQWEDISDNVSNGTNTVWRIRRPDIRSQKHLSFDHSKSQFPPQFNGKNS